MTERWFGALVLEPKARVRPILRITITHAAHGQVDGVSLANFQVGLTYDVSASLGTFLVTIGCAEVAAEGIPVVTTPVLTPDRFVIGGAVSAAERAALARDRQRKND